MIKKIIFLICLFLGDLFSLYAQARATEELLDGLQDFKKGRYSRAANNIWKYLSANQRGQRDYEKNEFYFAESLHRLGFNQASLEFFYNVIKNKAMPEIVFKTLGIVEEILEEYPTDYELILEDLIIDTDFGYLPEELNDMVSFHRGKRNYELGFFKWGDLDFSLIAKDTIYYHKSLFIKALQALKEEKVDLALSNFEEIRKSEDFLLSNLALTNAARLYYEKGDYLKSLDYYNTIELSLFQQNQIFLEKAWATYFTGNLAKALGYLYTLESPYFQPLYAPETYLLQTIIYRDLCDYPIAIGFLREFKRRYFHIIEKLKENQSIFEEKEILTALNQNWEFLKIKKFMDNLVLEKRMAEEYKADWRNSKLFDFLNSVYSLKIKEGKEKIKKVVEEKTKEIGEELLLLNKQVEYLEYEIKIDKLRRKNFKELITKKEKEEDPLRKSYLEKNHLTPKEIFWPKDDEFWTDEINDFHLFAEDRCE